SPDTARVLPRGCVGHPVGPGMLLSRAPAACEWITPAGLPAPPGEVIASFVPTAVRSHLLSGAPVPEHRTATIAFLQYGGLDEVVVREGADAAARRLDELVRLVQEAAERRRAPGGRRGRGAHAARASPHRRGRPVASAPGRRAPRTGVQRTGRAD